MFKTRAPSNMLRVSLVLAVLAGLVASLQYAHELRLQPAQAAAVSPRLHPAQSQSDEGAVFLAAGDIANCGRSSLLGRGFDRLIKHLGYDKLFKLRPVGAFETAQLIEQHPTANVLALGDLAYPDGQLVRFTDCYDKAWGRFKDRTFPTPGNHEYRTSGADGYFSYWSRRAGPDRRGYYLLRSNGWLILSLNSEIAADPGSPQYNWIKRTLKKHPTQCVLAFFHKPAVSSQKRRNSQSAKLLHQLLLGQGASVVLNGHNHFFEPVTTHEPNESIPMRTFVVGTGGKVASRIDVSTRKRAFPITTRGVLKLVLSPNRYRWQFLTVADPEGASIAGQERCRRRTST